MSIYVLISRFPFYFILHFSSLYVDGDIGQANESFSTRSFCDSKKKWNPVKVLDFGS